jgi:hypothetical protein
MGMCKPANEAFVKLMPHFGFEQMTDFWGKNL